MRSPDPGCGDRSDDRVPAFCEFPAGRIVHAWTTSVAGLSIPHVGFDHPGTGGIDRRYGQNASGRTRLNVEHAIMPLIEQHGLLVVAIMVAAAELGLPTGVSPKIALILAGGAVGALQAVSGLMLLEGRPQGAALGQASLVLSAILTLLVVGFRLAPSDVYYWLRWKYVAGYLVYAVVGMWILQKKTSGVISAEERGRK